MKMKKFIDDPAELTKDLLDGFSLAFADFVELDGRLVISRRLRDADRVTVVTQSGTGHEPAMCGFLGEGMADIAVAGEIFAAPDPKSVADALIRADKGHGVLFIVFNHAGDMLTANAAVARAKRAGIRVARVNVQDDISQQTRENADDRRGLGGGCALFHIAGAAAARHLPLEEVAAIAQRYADNMATLGVAARCATHPANGESFGDLGDDMMEIGMGQHGEGGGGRMALKTARETVGIMADRLADDLKLSRGDRVLVMLNGSGSTSLMELLIAYRDVVQHFNARGIMVAANWIGEILTTQEQAGFQFSITRLDDELLDLWNSPASSPYFFKK